MRMIYTIAARTLPVRATLSAVDSLGIAQLGELVRIAPGYYLNTEVSPRIPSHPSHHVTCTAARPAAQASHLACPARPY